jgi:hypothetical protein
MNMENNEYINTTNIGASGLLGKPDMQAKFGTQFVPTGKFSVQGNREFDTLANALAYIRTNVSAFPGIVITISLDGNNNGAYLVENDTPTEENTNGLKLSKLSIDNGPVQSEISWEVISDKEE